METVYYRFFKAYCWLLWRLGYVFLSLRGIGNNGLFNTVCEVIGGCWLACFAPCVVLGCLGWVLITIDLGEGLLFEGKREKMEKGGGGRGDR